jgi:hypothetical protein
VTAIRLGTIESAVRVQAVRFQVERGRLAKRARQTAMMMPISPSSATAQASPVAGIAAGSMPVPGRATLNGTPTARAANS